MKREVLSPWIVLSAVIFGAGAWAAWLRFTGGLGSVTNLNDNFPWGIWVGFDILCGVGLAAGGFTVSALVHVLRRKEYEPLARPAVLTAFVGYLLVVGGLMFDLGRPWAIWHPLVMWNPHSVMFEIAWCVTLYTTVLAAEVAVMVFERFRWVRATRIAHATTFPLTVAAVLLSMLHQSSLGSLFLIVPGRLHELWYTPLLPLLFFLSAMGAGLSMAIMESNISARGFNHPIPWPSWRAAARLAAWVLGICLTLRLADLVRTGALLQLRIDDRATWFFLLEISIGFIIPIALFASARVRRNRLLLYRASQLAVLGFVINRLNVSVTGFEVVSGYHYVPAWTEVAVTVMLIAVGAWAVFLAERYLPVLAEESESPGVARRTVPHPDRPAAAAPVR